MNNDAYAVQMAAIRHAKPNPTCRACTVEAYFAGLSAVVRSSVKDGLQLDFCEEWEMRHRADRSNADERDMMLGVRNSKEYMAYIKGIGWGPGTIPRENHSSSCRFEAEFEDALASVDMIEDISGDDARALVCRMASIYIDGGMDYGAGEDGLRRTL